MELITSSSNVLKGNLQLSDVTFLLVEVNSQIWPHFLQWGTEASLLLLSISAKNVGNPCHLNYVLYLNFVKILCQHIHVFSPL